MAAVAIVQGPRSRWGVEGQDMDIYFSGTECSRHCVVWKQQPQKQQLPDCSGSQESIASQDCGRFLTVTKVVWFWCHCSQFSMVTEEYPKVGLKFVCVCVYMCVLLW